MVLVIRRSAEGAIFDFDRTVTAKVKSGLGAAEGSLLFGPAVAIAAIQAASADRQRAAQIPRGASGSFLGAPVAAPRRELKKQSLSSASAEWGPKTEAFWQQLPAMTCLHGNLPFHNVFPQF